MQQADTNSTLQTYGYDQLFAERFSPYAEQRLLPARVIVEYQNIYRVITEHDGELLATISGRLRHHAVGRLDYPAVGDWVAVKLAPGTPGEERATVHAVLERKSRFVRKVAGSVVAEQVVAANVDTVLLVMALTNIDFSPRRLERYLVMSHESGARPVLVLTKADLADDLPTQLEIVKAVVGPNVPIHVVSRPRDEGYDELLTYLEPRKTVALLGSSGVGKSTIVNRLAGHELQRTQEVRLADGRGRHTTTHRQLLLLDGGGLMMDTPGMRELQLWDVDDGVDETFADIEALALECRFPNCVHDTEPGCAVVAAIEAGELGADRLKSYHHLRRELRSLAARQDVLNRKFEKSKMRAATIAFNKHQPRR